MDIYQNVRQLQDKKYEKFLYISPDAASRQGNTSRDPGDAATCRLSRPIMVICETVNTCSNNCIICPAQTMIRKKETMSLSLFEKVLQDYSDMGGGKLSLTPEIGDIFFDAHLPERLDLIRRYPKITGTTVTTNAILSDRYNDRDLQNIINSFERFQISVYGMDEEEYTLMTRRDTYQRMLRNIQRIIRLSKDSRSVVFAFRLLKPRTENEMVTWIRNNFHRNIAFSYAERYMDWNSSLDTSITLPYSALWREARANVAQCIIPLVACLIFSNGDVSFCSCNDYNGKEEFFLGNIAENTLTEIINSSKNQHLWKSPLYLPQSCQFCSSHRSFLSLDRYSYLFEDPIQFIGG